LSLVSRRARHPIAVLAVLAAVPAALLAGLYVFADGRVDEASVPVSTTTTTVAGVADAPTTTSLVTPLMSVRRSPTPLAVDRREDVLLEAVRTLGSSVDAASCMAVGIDDRLVAGTNTATPVIPASNLKVVVAAVAVEVLGAGAVFTTKVVGPAPVNGVIEGDIHLVGGGDPVLSEAWYTEPSATRKRPPIHATSAEALADALVAAGVTAVNGSIVGDGTRYDDERHPPGWSDDIRATVDGVPVGALVIDDSITEAGGINSDPAASAASAFRRMLRDRSVSVSGTVTAGVAPADAGVLATVTSAPLSDIVNEMLATSDNLTAEMLVKEIGLAVSGAGTRTAGLDAIAATLTEWGLPAGSVVLTDGSGLSRDNRLTCAALLTVLQRGTATDVVGAGLAVAGQDGSTLDGTFEDAGLAGVLRAKTGSLREVKALCGYFPAGDGEVAFVLILNGPSAAGFQATWQLLSQALLAVGAAPSSDALAPVQP
jgi:D-alanyl-D-alanine carboxypeptidase/D-alanyl-D-alanine-endopeptidase (penicillin-binding protein 4)